MIVYVETSAAAKLLVEEEAADRLAEHLDQLVGPLVSGMILETELRRLAVRIDLAQSAACSSGSTSWSPIAPSTATPASSRAVTCAVSTRGTSPPRRGWTQT